MTETEMVACLYVVGALVTVVGVVMAYRRARIDLQRLERIGDLHESHDDQDPMDDFKAAKAGDEQLLAERKGHRDADQAALTQELEAAGLHGEGPSWKDMSLPMEYWTKRSALRDAVASFKTGGLVALGGLAISTIASVWSLYLSP